MIYAENILLCIAIPLCCSLLFVSGDVRRFVGAFLLGMGVCLLSAYISGFINMATGLGSSDTSVFISPIVEELMKLMPLLFFLLMFEPESSVLANIATAIGAGFATFENCCYILSSGADNLSYVMIRGMSVGIMHIVSIFSLAMWFDIAKRLKVLSFPIIIGAMSLSMTFHAIYNLLVFGGGTSAIIGYLLPLFTAIVLAILYKRLQEKLVR